MCAPARGDKPATRNLAPRRPHEKLRVSDGEHYRQIIIMLPSGFRRAFACNYFIIIPHAIFDHRRLSAAA
jgi:hypothetical protein